MGEGVYQGLRYQKQPKFWEANNILTYKKESKMEIVIAARRLKQRDRFAICHVVVGRHLSKNIEASSIIKNQFKYPIGNQQHSSLLTADGILFSINRHRFVFLLSTICFHGNIKLIVEMYPIC